MTGGTNLTSGWSEWWRHGGGQNEGDDDGYDGGGDIWQNIRQWVGGELLAKFPNLQSYDPK